MRRLAFVILVVLGFGIAGYAVFLWPTPTGTTYYFDVTPVDDTQVRDGPVVSYADLSADNRRLFDRALGSGTAPVGAETTPLNARYVAYDDTYYETLVRPAEPDDSTGPARLVMFAVGGLGTIAGTFGIVGFWFASWTRHRPTERIDEED